MLNINLLDWRQEEYQKRKKRFFTLLLLFALVAILLLFLTSLFFAARIHNFKNDNAYLEKVLVNLTPDIAAAQDFVVQEAVTRKMINLINQLQKNRDIPIRLLVAFSQIPAHINLKNINYKNNTLTLTGTGSSLELDALIQNWSAQKALFTSVLLTELTMLPNQDAHSQSFTITANLKKYE